MKKFILIIFFILTAISCKNDMLSEADQQKVTELNNKAIELRIRGEINKAEELYKEILEIDKADVNTLYALVGIYAQKNEIKKAFDMLNELSENEKTSSYYYQVKGNIFEFDGDLKNVKENYIKAYELGEVADVKTESDLNVLIGYAMLETLAGHKEKALDRINEALQLDWITDSNKESLQMFRNEFEFYQGKGAKEFDDEAEVILCTTNKDSLRSVLKQHHINISSFVTGKKEEGKQVWEVRVHEKFRSGLEKLRLEECK